MASWYCSRQNWNALAQWAATTAYIIGDFVRPVTTATSGVYYVFRVSAITTGISGGTEPAWPANNNATVVNGGVTFQNVTGQETYGWTAAGGTLDTTLRSATTGIAAGDNIFVASDHTETGQATTGGGLPSTGAGQVKVLSVDRAGSVPPVAADLLAGASRGMSTPSWQQRCAAYWWGISFSQTGAWQIVNTNTRGMVLEDCSLDFSGQANTNVMVAAGAGASLRLINTSMVFAGTSQSLGFSTSQANFEWLDTAAPASGTLPTILFAGASASAGQTITCRGVDFTAFGSGKTLVSFPTAIASGMKVLFDSCTIDPAVTRVSATPISPTDIVELINCDDGAGNILNERYTFAGSVVTERSITLVGGAEDDVGPFSFAMVSGTFISFNVIPLVGFTMDVENTVVGSAQTATVEIISSGTLTNEDVIFTLQYMGTTGSSIASFVTTAPATLLTAPTNLPASSETWANSPSTPQKQYLQVTFTAETEGRLRGTIVLGKPSTTIYYNPSMVIA